ncbi:hypothetical protein TYRP_011210 [Tyrophagus putrescentiae]|nr:hypothetical protein TYRP_011210 [Tyrophagus putrescentiae]
MRPTAVVAQSSKAVRFSVATEAAVQATTIQTTAVQTLSVQATAVVTTSQAITVSITAIGDRRHGVRLDDHRGCVALVDNWRLVDDGQSVGHCNGGCHQGKEDLKSEQEY